MMSNEQQLRIEVELERGRGLLSTQRVGVGLVETEAEPTPEQMGALAGIGLKSTDLPAQGNLYVFAELDESKETINRLEDETLPSGYHQVSAMSGVLVFLARARVNVPDGEAIRALLDAMLNAFTAEG
jgi:hypothetical protein